MSEKEDDTRQDLDGDEMGATHGSSDRSKLWRYFLVKVLGAEIGNEVGSYDGMLYGNIVEKI